MTIEQLSALEWAISALKGRVAALAFSKGEDHSDTIAAGANLATLNDLYDAERASSYWASDSQRSMYAWMRSARVTIPLKEFDGWRTCEPEYGSIGGIPNSYGRLEATNGILCYIAQERVDGSTFMFLGHLDRWTRDEKFHQRMSEDQRHAAQAARQRRELIRYRNNLQNIAMEIKCPTERAAAMKKAATATLKAANAALPVAKRKTGNNVTARYVAELDIDV